jgi:threonine synthase
MGLPIEQLIIASNENDILPRTMTKGLYATKEVKQTSSPSMDIQISSNFERYLFEASNRDAATIRSQMDWLKQSGRFQVGPALAAYREDFNAAAASETEVGDAIRHLIKHAGYMMDPHTACAYVALQKCRTPAQKYLGDDPKVILATAHPAKFPETMVELTGTHPALPPRLVGLMSAMERFKVLDNDLTTVQQHVEAVAAQSAGARL